MEVREKATACNYELTTTAWRPGQGIGLLGTTYYILLVSSPFGWLVGEEEEVGKEWETKRNNK